MLQSLAEKLDNILGSKAFKMGFFAAVMIFLGLFLLKEYERNTKAVCSGIQYVIERNIPIEEKLIAEGHKKNAILLHNSLEKLAKKADDCDTTLIKKLLRRKL
jgi:hypothetical protein